MIFDDLSCRIGFGGAAVSGEGGGYGFGAINTQSALTLIQKAYDVGIQVFDSAPVYGFGLSEQRIGQALKSVREKVILVTKGGVTWSTEKRIDINNKPEVIKSMLEQSLRDLDTDYIDLYMIHWPDPRVDIRLPMQVLSDAKKRGQIKAIGLCNTFAEDFEKASEIDEVTVLQSPFNFFETQARDNLFPLVRQKNLGFMSYGTLDKGILTGRVDAGRTFDEYDCRRRAPWWKKADRRAKYDALADIFPKLQALGFDGLGLALGFVLQQKDVSTALCGMRSLEQLSSVFDTLEHLPSAALIEEMRHIYLGKLD